MVSRRSRGYKDKGYMAAFGQFMLPLAVVMAIALLYFSMKLFFLTPGGTGKNGSVDSGVVSVDVTPTVQPAADTPPKPATQATQTPVTPATSVQTPGSTASKPAVTAGPVGPTAQSQVKPATTPAVTPPANTVQPKPAVTAGTSQPAKPAATAAAAAVQRYDVQIGAFTTRENAQQLLQKARGQGHDVYINEAVHNGAPYFRVRVKGSAQKAEAQTLSAKLQGQDYPVYIVPIAK